MHSSTWRHTPSFHSRLGLARVFRQQSCRNTNWNEQGTLLRQCLMRRMIEWTIQLTLPVAHPEVAREKHLSAIREFAAMCGCLRTPNPSLPCRKPEAPSWQLDLEYARDLLLWEEQTFSWLALFAAVLSFWVPVLPHPRIHRLKTSYDFDRTEAKIEQKQRPRLFWGCLSAYIKNMSSSIVVNDSWCYRHLCVIFLCHFPQASPRPSVLQRF